MKIVYILINLIANIDGAYSLIISYDDNVYLVRDSLGMRPLSISTKNGMLCACSESSLYDKIGFSFLREVKPGEIVRINNNNMISLGIYDYKNNLNKHASCTLEYVYLSNNE